MQDTNVLSIDRNGLTEICQRFKVAKLSIFGSILREDFDPRRSDIDMLVEFSHDANKSLFSLIRLQTELSEMLGKKVDLTPPPKSE